MKIIILLLGMVFLWTGSSKKTISGEAFVVTKGRQNIKLALLTIKFVPERIYNLAIKQSEIDSLLDLKIAEDKKLLKTLLPAIKGYEDLDDNPNLQIALKDIYKDMLKNRARIQRTVEGKALVIISSKLDTIKDKRILTVKTNSDGKFSIKLDSKKYFIMASTERLTYDLEEEYRWAFWYEPDDSQLLSLDNDNMVR